MILHIPLHLMCVVPACFLKKWSNCLSGTVTMRMLKLLMEIKETLEATVVHSYMYLQQHKEQSRSNPSLFCEVHNKCTFVGSLRGGDTLIQEISIKGNFVSIFASVTSESNVEISTEEVCNVC